MDTTCDDFLGGRLRVPQPATGYRAGVDPILLAASIPAKSGQRVLELGSGVGVASLALGARVADLDMTAIEIQPDYADLARQNAVSNQVDIDIITGDLAALPDHVRAVSFDHVFANPPYFDRTASTAAKDAGRETAMGEGTDLTIWVEQAAKRLAPKGYGHFIIRVERLLDLVSAIPSSCGSVVITPIVPRVGRDATLIILHMRKNGRAAPRVESPIIMHAGHQHDQNEKDYTELIEKVLRHGDALTAWYR